MLLPRLVPCLLLKGKGLVKGIKFKDHRYVGDPINAVQIFNTKEVDEIFFLDITATAENRIPPLDLIERIADHCLTPFAVGGGVRSLEDARQILQAGAEKICLNTCALQNPSLIRQISDAFGAQSVVVSIDYRKTWLGGYEVTTHCGTRTASRDLFGTIDQMVKNGAGEVILNSIDRDGTMSGYDVGLVREVSNRIEVPVIALGGAGNAEHLKSVIQEGGAAAAAAGSMFVFHGKLRAVLISYPEREVLNQIRGSL
jgi:cyclase